MIEEISSQQFQLSSEPEKSSIKLILQHAVLHGNLDELSEMIKVNKIDRTETNTTLAHSLLLYACAAGQVNIVQYLLNFYEGIDISYKDKYYLTPLLYTCALGHTEVAKLLVEFLLKTSNPEIILENNSFVTSDNNIVNPLHIVVARGNLKIMKLFALKFTRQLSNDYFYLSLNHLNIVKYLLCTKPFSSSDLSVALYLALKHNCLTTIQFIVTITASNHKTSELNNNNLLHLACLNGLLSVAKYFIESLNYLPNITGEKGTTPLHYAATSSQIDLVKYLIDTHHCDPLVKDQFNNTPLHNAANGGQLEVVKYFTEDLNIDVNMTGQYQRTALHLAAEFGHLDTVKYLIDTRHCDPLVKDEDNDAPLHTAANGGQLEVVKYFTEDLKIDVNLTGKYQRTALHHAAEFGHLDTVKYLIDTHHCDPLVKDQFTNTPLHNAAIGGQLEVVKYFTEDLKVDQCYRTISKNCSSSCC